jgi:hypothetical protein
VRKVRNSHKIYGGKPERKIPIWRFKHNRECNNKRDIKRIEHRDVGWTGLA